MKVSQETVGTREVLLTIEPDAATVQRAMRQAARRISRVRPVQGYRPGKAPYALVERMMGRETILNEALNGMAQQVYGEAIEEAGIEPYTQGELDVESDDPLVLTARVPLVPTCELGDYKELSVEQEAVEAVTDEDVDEHIAMLQQRHAEYEPVERAVEMGDQIVCDITGVADGETVVEREGATMGVSDDLMAPGFGEALVGMTTEEEREFSLTYPEDYADDNLADKQVAFTVKIETIRETILPEIDDDLAKMVGDYDTLEELRESTAANLLSGREAAARQAEAAAAIEQLVGIAEVEYPEVAVNEEIEQAISRQASQIQQMGFTMEAYLRMMNTTIEDLREQMRPGAERGLTERLALQEFAQKEELTITQEELGEAMQRLATQVSMAYGDQAPEMLQRMQSQGMVYSVFADELVGKAQRHLVALLTGREDELEYTKEDEAEDAIESDEALEAEVEVSDEAESDEAE